MPLHIAFVKLLDCCIERSQTLVCWIFDLQTAQLTIRYGQPFRNVFTITIQTSRALIKKVTADDSSLVQSWPIDTDVDQWCKTSSMSKERLFSTYLVKSLTVSVYDLFGVTGLMIKYSVIYCQINNCHQTRAWQTRSSAFDTLLARKLRSLWTYKQIFTKSLFMKFSL